MLVTIVQGGLAALNLWAASINFADGRIGLGIFSLAVAAWCGYFAWRAMDRHFNS